MLVSKYTLGDDAGWKMRKFGLNNANDVTDMTVELTAKVLSYVIYKHMTTIILN